MEVCTKSQLNPIVHDVNENNQPRYVANVFPCHGYLWNYGIFPQTYENPAAVDKWTRLPGDGDPLDVIEIGERVYGTGEVVEVKLLGALALIDGGHTDWKVIAIAKGDPRFNLVNNIKDVRARFPGLLDVTQWWLRVYKLKGGGPENTFLLNGQLADADMAAQVVNEAHRQWKMLLKSGAEVEQYRSNTQLENAWSVGHLDAKRIVYTNDSPSAPGPLPACVEEWFFSPILMPTWW